MQNGVWTWLDQTNSYTYTAGSWYTATVTTDGSSTSAWFTQGPSWSTSDSTLTGGTVAFKTSSAEASFDNLRVRGDYIYSLGNTLGERVRSASAVTKYYYAGSKRIGMRNANALSYIFADHLGGTSVISSTVSGTVSAISFFPYGSTRSGSVPSDYKFTGQREDSATGLYDYNARLYDPALGRFISPDTIVPDGTRPQALNRYAYAYDNPVRYNDPSGHASPIPKNRFRDVKIDISLWPDFAKGLAFVAGSFMGLNVDLWNDTITRPTDQQYAEMIVTNATMPPMGMSAGRPLGMAQSSLISRIEALVEERGYKEACND